MATAARYVTARQLARALGVSPDTARYWCRTGRVAAQRTLGGHYRVAAADLERLRAVLAAPVVAPVVATGERRAATSATSAATSATSATTSLMPAATAPTSATTASALGRPAHPSGRSALPGASTLPAEAKGDLGGARVLLAVGEDVAAAGEATTPEGRLLPRGGPRRR